MLSYSKASGINSFKDNSSVKYQVEPNESFVSKIKPLSQQREKVETGETYGYTDQIITIKTDSNIELPQYRYVEDKISGVITRYLLVAKDSGYNTDSYFGPPQRWLLFARQGDHIHRVTGYNEQDPIRIEAERHNQMGYSTLNEGIVWSNLPQSSINLPIYYEKYQQHLDYQQRQLDEDE